MHPFNKNLKAAARKLRKNMTVAERLVWQKIRGKQLKRHQFYRQKNIGNYIVDFYCPAAKLVIEIDGGQHYTESGAEEDRKRDRYLKDLGFSVLRFSNLDVFHNLEGVLERIEARLGDPL